jgi:hypothetical protein
VNPCQQEDTSIKKGFLIDQKALLLKILVSHHVAMMPDVVPLK